MQTVVGTSDRSSPPSVLVVDDDRHMLNVLELTLTARLPGWQVETHDRPMSALQVACRGGYDVVVVDWHMPEIEGPEFIARLLETCPDQRVILHSAVDRARIEALCVDRSNIVGVPKSHRSPAAIAQRLIELRGPDRDAG